MVVTLDNLDEKALIKILTEPKNALTKQYEHLLAMIMWNWISKKEP